MEKLPQIEVDQSNNETAIDRNRTLSDPESLLDNNNAGQVTPKTTNDTLARYKRMISSLKSPVLYLRKHAFYGGNFLFKSSVLRLFTSNTSQA